MKRTRKKGGILQRVSRYTKKKGRRKKGRAGLIPKRGERLHSRPERVSTFAGKRKSSVLKGEGLGQR